jgi:hypothetical protein
MKLIPSTLGGPKQTRKNSEDWDILEEYLLRKYSGVANVIDAYQQWWMLTPPSDKETFEKYIEDFRLYGQMAKIDINHMSFALSLLVRLPRSVMQQMIRTSGQDEVITIEEVITTARAYFSSVKRPRYVSQGSQAMEVDMIRGDPNRKVPPYYIFSRFLSKEEYNRRLTGNLCLGCGEGHQWKDCPIRPKVGRD